MAPTRKRKRTAHGWTHKSKKAPAPSSAPDPSPAARTHLYSQDESLFFRLPPELREIIYAEIFTFSVPRRQMEQLGQTVQGELCRNCRLASHEQCTTRMFGGDRITQVLEKPLPHEKVGLRVGAMLRTCWRIYNETLPTLYRINTFYIENPRTILEAAKRMPQSNLHLIRCLTLVSPPFHRHRFDWKDEQNMARWKEVVDALGSSPDAVRSEVLSVEPRVVLTALGGRYWYGELCEDCAAWEQKAREWKEKQTDVDW
ncbi:hypothetical protein BDW74DRAFT_171984 [Aspergillus multicolor]|uniref:uncharacterized protein n=1 Tax=Aspergillus multicolor TaxID=41759 RepID=UPI003CCD8908